MYRHVVKRNLNNLTSLLQIINTLQQELFSKYQSSFREICHFPAFIISPEQSEAMHQKYCRDHAGCNCSNALHIYIWALFMKCYFKKRRISSSLKGSDWLLPVRHSFILGFSLSLCNKFFRNPSPLLKNSIHHKPSREEADFDGHNTIFQSTVSFLLNLSCCLISARAKIHKAFCKY